MDSSSKVVPSSTEGINAETLAKLHALEQYDMSFLTDAFNDRLIREGRTFSTEQIYPILAYFGKADEELAKRLETEFKRFVAVTLVRPGIVHAPSGPVDMYWHFFLLHTQQYRQFCTDIWGNDRA
jgi:hypothetical protein